jgi:hypothetical protein
MHIQEKRWQFWFCNLLTCFIILCSFNVDKALSVVAHPAPFVANVEEGDPYGIDEFLKIMGGIWMVETLMNMATNFIKGEPILGNSTYIYLEEAG